MFGRGMLGLLVCLHASLHCSRLLGFIAAVLHRVWPSKGLEAWSPAPFGQGGLRHLQKCSLDSVIPLWSWFDWQPFFVLVGFRARDAGG